MKFIGIVSVVLFSLVIVACDNDPSLQKYYVDNQESKDFIAVDVPASMFANAGSLDEEQKRTLETIKKVNVLAIPKKETNQDKIETEKENIFNILKDEKYQLLMKFGGGTSRVEVYFTGEEEAVDEIILYGYDDEKGMGIARVLGDNMNPGDILSLIKSMEKGDVNIEGFSEITQMFVEKPSVEKVE